MSDQEHFQNGENELNGDQIHLTDHENGEQIEGDLETNGEQNGFQNGEINQQNNQPEGLASDEEEVETDIEETIPEEEYQQLQQQAQAQNEQNQEGGEQDIIDPTQIKRTRIVKKKVVRKKLKTSEIQEIKIPESECIEWFVEKVKELDAYSEDIWDRSLKLEINDFIHNSNKVRLFFWIEENRIRVSDSEPPYIHETNNDIDFLFFVKAERLDEEITIDNINDLVTYSIVNHEYLKHLLKTMNSNFIPAFMNDQSWPENVKKEFLSQLHKFMAQLTETAHRREGITKLYIPNEDLTDPHQVIQDKELIQRLETTLIHWSRQIKDVLNNQDSGSDLENVGPLDEIAHWRQRKENLSFINQQLERPKLKKIVNILKLSDSSYLKAFDDLASSISAGSIEAEDNLKFLKSLQEPCKKLEEAEPKDIPAILPGLLFRVRMIWERSKYYNTTERISSLLRKISNEIIKRCKSQISIKDMLDGDVEKCMKDLKDSKDCCEEWERIFEKTRQQIAKKGGKRRWDFNYGSIFAQVDAFIQRCNDLSEICDGQLQFARKGSDSQMPCFGGSKGPEIVNILEEIKISFRKHLDKIRGSDQDKILDVKSTKWHDDYSAFKNGMKDLDVMYQNIITFAFDSVTTVQQGVEMLEAFDYLAKRDSIRNFVNKKAHFVIDLFNKELDKAKLEYDIAMKRGIVSPITHGEHSAMAIWVRSLMIRVENLKKNIDLLTFVEDTIKRPALEKYDSLQQRFRQYIMEEKYKNHWRNKVKEYEDIEVRSKLERQILCKVKLEETTSNSALKTTQHSKKARLSHLESYFDRSLLRLIIEVSSWRKLLHFGIMIPNFADEILPQKEHLRILREFVMLVVRDYNKIIDSMDDSDSLLFDQHLQNTDKELSAGLQRLKWSTKYVLEDFVRVCRGSCAELYKMLMMYKNNKQKIQGKCKEISQINFIKLDKKRVYVVAEFEDEQSKNRVSIGRYLQAIFLSVKSILNETYEIFYFQKPEIQKQWFLEVAQIDDEIEKALKRAVRTSLQELNKVINGDSKTNPTPIFQLTVKLKEVELGFEPTREYLQSMMSQTIAAINEIISYLPRMEKLMHDQRKHKLEELWKNIQEQSKNQVKKRSTIDINELTGGKDISQIEDLTQKRTKAFYEKIAEEPEIKKLTDKILQGLKSTCDKLGNLLDPWRKWEKYYLNVQERFARTMIRNAHVSTLRSEIENFEHIQSEVSSNKSTDVQDCIQLDNSHIKNDLVDILIQWQNTQLNIIQEMTIQELDNLHQVFKNSEETLMSEPQDLQQLKKRMDTWKKLTDEKDSYEASLQPLEDKFKLLEDYSITLRDEDQLKRSTLRDAWNRFLEMLEWVSQSNAKHRTYFRNETLRHLDEFLKETSDSKQHFLANAPFSASGLDNERAFTILNEYKEQIKIMRRREEQMKFAFDLFEISYGTNPDLEQIEKEIATLEEVWTSKENWDKKWDDIKSTQFKKINVDSFDEIAEGFMKLLTSRNKDVRKWDISIFMENKVREFKQTLPLIEKLLHPAMRERHWRKLRQIFNSPSFNPDSQECDFEQTYKLGLLQHAEAVRETTEVAEKQHQLEVALLNIEKLWDSQAIDTEQHKKYFKIKNPDKIFGPLEDNMMIISSMKTSAFYQDFVSQIEKWEVTLTVMLETLELLLDVQRKWLYLESIFSSQQNDQDKQLLGDISKFQALNSRLQTIMQRINEERNAKNCLCVEGLAKELGDISIRLDESQRILFELLETKRREFPRFYFISNDDLFELLGQSKEPKILVNNHIKKCFEGIKVLDFAVSQGQKTGLQKMWDITSMSSPEKETIKFLGRVPCEFGPSKYLRRVEDMMRETLKKIVQNCITKFQAGKKKELKWLEGWITEFPGQLLVTALQIHWTYQCQEALNLIQTGQPDKNRAWKQFKEEQKRVLEEFTRLIRKTHDEITRMKLIALITIESHAKDIIEVLIKRCNSPNSFEWMQQLRFKYEESADSCVVTINQTNTAFYYGFEYQGNNGRLVVTPLTDRCYMTLTTAMHLKRGGAPQGPAGTGKTETVKDLGKNMAKFVLVFNCSEGLDYKSLGRMYTGLILTGGWGCFDEFNRIEIEVLSVVASQISTILAALACVTRDDYNYTFNFEESTLQLNPSCAIFITMNPGYAGRTELPDNLKSLFRPVAMMVPDSIKICEIMLKSEGFNEGENLSKKMVALYNLMTQQLSKQDHYDFGLRAIKSVLTCAGAIRREESASIEERKKAARDPEKQEQYQQVDEKQEEQKILMRAIRDMNIPKFIAEDIPLFNALFQDLFPSEDIPESTNNIIEEAIRNQFYADKLQLHESMILKVIQLYDSKRTRHGNMLVGSALSGKSTCWKILSRALNTLNENDHTKHSGVKTVQLNPKSISLNELFGFVDQNTMEWNEGVLSHLMGEICKDETNKERWMILDGPVDTLWIESLNTVLDDNKVLTLLNGDRISLPQQVGLIFEVDDLATASPATVSRCGMVYLDLNELGWKPYVDSWIEKKEDSYLKEFLSEMFDKWLPKILKTKRQCKELVPALESNLVMSLCKLMDSIVKKENGISYEETNKDENYFGRLEKWFTFALLWSVGASVNEDGRKRLDYALRDVESIFPHQGTVYDYYISVDKGEWASWEERLSAMWKPRAGTPFHKIMVPTVDTTRNRFIIQNLLKSRVPVLCVGVTGTGKTSIIQSVLQGLEETYSQFTITFSAQTSSNKVQEIIESKFIKRTKDKMIPDGGKKAVFFLDDLNMPRKDKFGAQPPLELIRQYIDYEGWYDRHNLELFKYILDMQLIGSMGPPGGGRAEISKRFQSKFNLINFTFPSDSQVQRIFLTIIGNHFSQFDEEIKPLAEPLSLATLNMYKLVSEHFLPTPTKSHYVFNLRDISKVFQGLTQVDKYFCDTKISILRAWVHECLRVFSDRLSFYEDRVLLKKFIGDQLEILFQSNIKDCFDGDQEPIFADFLEENYKENSVYQEVQDRVRLKKFMEDKLVEHNNDFKRRPMDIVLFKEAILYVCKIYRIIRLGKGHALLVGEGGSGRHSLSKLAAHIAGYEIFQLEITKNFKPKEFREEVKKMCELLGVKDLNGIFLISDNDILHESFIEDINNILTLGEVPNLYTKEEMSTIREKIRRRAREAGRDKNDEDIWDFFMTRVQSNLHVVFCMSKTGDNLRNLTRMYPGLVNNTTTIWFMAWPEDALIEVASKFIEPLNFEETLRKSISEFFSHVHIEVIEYSDRMYKELKRLYYVTPTNYIELVQGYFLLLKEKQFEMNNELKKLSFGLEKLEEAKNNSDSLNIMLEKNRMEVSNKQKESEEYGMRISQQEKDAEEKRKEVEQSTSEVEKEKNEIEALATEAEADLARAEPALIDAEERLASLQSKDIAEIKAYTAPPAEVGRVLSAILTLLNKDTSWASAKRELAKPEFMKELQNYPKDSIGPKLISRLEKFTQRSDMEPQSVSSKSYAAGELWKWVLAMEKYAKAFRDIEPKKQKLHLFRDKLKNKEDKLIDLQSRLKEINDTISSLNQNLDKVKKEIERYKDEAKELQIDSDRAEKLVFGLASSRESWSERREKLQQLYDKLVGDCLISAAFLAYAGPFPSEYRQQLLKQVMIGYVRDHKISYTLNYSFAEFLEKPAIIQKWNSKGLPQDQFSIENGVLVKKGRRWPLMIDPQLQANKWIKKLEGDKLIVLDPYTDNFMNHIEKAIFTGKTVLFENLEEEIDPGLEPILNKQLKKVGGQTLIFLGDKEIGYNENFKLYLTTKLGNPKYKAEVSTRVTLVNFTVKQNGLQQQLLSIVISRLEKDLEKKRNTAIENLASFENKLKELDEEILHRLQTTKGSLIKDDELIKVLQTSKETEDLVKTNIEQEKQTMKKVNLSRETFKRLSEIAAILFFVINDLNNIDNMYQFSLESYIELFKKSIESPKDNSQMIDDVKEKLLAIEERHILNTYLYASRALFEKDKLLLAMQIAVQVSQFNNDLELTEYKFFLLGGEQIEQENTPKNPGPEWLTDTKWENVLQLDKLPVFNGIVNSFMHNTKEWKRWFLSDLPEDETLPPGEWSKKIDELKNMIVLKCLRPDRVLFEAAKFVKKKLGSDQFITPKPLNLKELYDESDCSTPILFILSAGVDPYPNLMQLAQTQEKTLVSISLGQGQAKFAKKKLYDGAKNGLWVYLANCHLSVQFLAELEKILDSIKSEISDSFRLWLSSNPHPRFPISMLQRCVKVTTEPPKGIKNNMIRLYTSMTEEQFSRVQEKERHKYKKLLFSLCWFHTVIIERKKFKTLGWNVMYDFNDSDFSICRDILYEYIDKNTDKSSDSVGGVPWEAIRFLIAEVNYGGRVTDEWDRRLLKVYAEEFFDEKILNPEEKFRLAPDPLTPYFVPDDAGWKPTQDQSIKTLNSQSQTAQFYELKIREFPSIEKPDAFGQHINAQISSQIADTYNLINSILSLQPRSNVVGGESKEYIVEKKIAELLDKIPSELDQTEIYERIGAFDQHPLKIVLLQEIQRYNKLLATVKASLINLDKGLKGFVLISEELEDILYSIYENKVPILWSSTYHSLKPLGSWIEDLDKRIEQLRNWAYRGQPNVFWISGFSFPTGFTTAILQQSARIKSIPIDTLDFEFNILGDTQSSPPKEGAYINGLSLEGAKWDYEKGCLEEADPMRLFYSMPIIHLRPINKELKLKSKKGVPTYVCPCYMFPLRTSIREKPSYMFSITLNSGNNESNFWVKRGTALLMSLAE